jgi:hypothetical protein
MSVNVQLHWRGLLQLLLWLSLWPFSAATAAIFPDLYTVLVTPGPDAADARTEGIALAMGQLLTRITGRRDAAWDPDLLALTQAPDRYVDAVGFQTADQLMVRFNQRAVDAALEQAARPVWGAERPMTLIWMAVMDDAGERAILGADQVDPTLTPVLADALRGVRDELRAVAYERGLPITLPLRDLEDLSALEFADVWGGFTDRILAASARYEADAVLVGKLRLSALGNEVQWTVLDRGRLRGVLGGVVRDGLDAVADSYAVELATVGGLSQVRLRVLNVRSLQDYGRLMNYLESLSILQSLQLASFEDGALSLQVSVRGDEAVLQRLFTLGGVLRQATGFMPALGEEPALVWQLVDSGRRSE